MTIAWKNQTLKRNWQKARRFAVKNDDLSHGKLMDYAEGIIGQKRPNNISARFVANGGTGDCYCGHKRCKHTERLTLEINGKLPDPTGIQLGSDCAEYFTYIFEGLSHEKFRIRRNPPSQREIQSRLEDIAVELSAFPEKALNFLEREGFDLDTKVAAGAVKDLLRSIYKKDKPGVKRKLDYVFAKDMFDWGIEHKEQADNYPNIRRIISKLENGSKVFLTREEFATYMLFYWQERQLDPKEIKPLRDEIKYLRTATSGWQKNPFKPNPAIQTEKFYDRTRKEKFSLDELLDEKRGGITKAQINAIEKATNITEARIIYNESILSLYAITWESTLECLSETFNEQKETYRLARKQGIKKPELKWGKDGHSALKAFFEDAEQKCATNNIGFVDYILEFVRANKAIETIDTLFVAGQKLKLAVNTKNETVYKTAHNRIEPNYIEDLEKIANSAVDNSKQTREKLKEARITAKKYNEAQEKIKESAKYGIIPTKYLQDGTLQKMRKVVEGYEKRPDLAEAINELIVLENNFVRLKFNVRAEDGKEITSKKDTPFKTQTYAGRTYFSKEQAQAIETILKAIPFVLRKSDYTKCEKIMKDVDAFFAKNSVYEFDKYNKPAKIKLPESHQEKGITCIPVGWYLVAQSDIPKYVPVKNIRKELETLMKKEPNTWESFKLILQQENAYVTTYVEGFVKDRIR